MLKHDIKVFWTVLILTKQHQTDNILLLFKSYQVSNPILLNKAVQKILSISKKNLNHGLKFSLKKKPGREDVDIAY